MYADKGVLPNHKQCKFHDNFKRHECIHVLFVMTPFSFYLFYCYDEICLIWTITGQSERKIPRPLQGPLSHYFEIKIEYHIVIVPLSGPPIRNSEIKTVILLKQWTYHVNRD